jgi:hypothetical protein
MNQLTKTYKLLSLSIFFMAVIFLTACGEKDEHVKPNVSFKTGATYVSADKTVGKDSVITVGIIAKKTEDELKTLNVSYALDGATTTTTFNTLTLTKAEEDGFEKDVTIKTRSQAGTERWVFTVTDRDGNIANVEFKLTVK